MYRDSSGRTLAEYPQPSVAVDIAVLTVGPDERLDVLLVRRDDDRWALPGTFLHEKETLDQAVLRALDEKVGLRGTSPRQLHVFDAPERDDRGWVLSVAHVVVLPWKAVQPAVARREGDIAVRPVDDVRGLCFDHDDIVCLAADQVRADHRERPDPAGLLDEPFTLRELRRLHEAVLGRLEYSADTFRRAMAPQLREEPGKLSAGRVGKPARLYRRR